MAKVSLISGRDIAFWVRRFDAPLSECLTYLDMAKGKFFRSPGPNKLIPAEYVLIEIHPEEATWQLPPGFYVVPMPDPQARTALFEAQYC